MPPIPDSCHRRSVLITGARAPVALHMARLLDGAGWHVVLADTPAHPIAAASRSCARYCRLPPPRWQQQRYGDAVEALVADEQPVLVIPTCEEIFYLAAIWQQRRLATPLLAPEPALLESAHDKYAFIQQCRRLGLETPQTFRLASREALLALRAEAHRLVFKPVWSRFASRVLIRPTPGQLNSVLPTPAMPWVAQEYVAGEEISSYALARHGRLLAHSLYRCRYRAGRGAGIYLEPLEDRRASAFMAAFVEGTQWNGQIAFDLMRRVDGRIVPLECNPRATSGLHFFRQPQPFVSALIEGVTPCLQDVDRPQMVRLAMWLYGHPRTLRPDAWRRFRHDLRDAEELLAWPADNAPRRAQWCALAEIALLAARSRTGLQRASTRDIEWDGPSQRSI